LYWGGTGRAAVGRERYEKGALLRAERRHAVLGAVDVDFDRDF
jgi:hypothetical protein